MVPPHLQAHTGGYTLIQRSHWSSYHPPHISPCLDFPLKKGLGRNSPSLLTSIVNCEFSSSYQQRFLSSTITDHWSPSANMKMPSLAWINLEWRWQKFFYVLIVAEVPFTVSALALFGIADPDLYRTQLWQEGAKHGWNSDPIEILYSYANYAPISTPTPWNQWYVFARLILDWVGSDRVVG